MSSRMKVVLAFPLFALTGILQSAELSRPGSELRDVLKMHENLGGFAVTVGDDTEGIFCQLSRQDHYAVHGLFRSEETLAAVRKRLMAEGRYGKSCAALWSGGELPYVENLVSLLICKDEASVSTEEVLRVLSPNGMAVFADGEGWKVLKKPLNADTDTWPQYFYGPENNPVSKDKLVGPPRHLQWRGSPRWGRFHEKMSSFAAMVSAGGRVFYIMDEGSPSSIFFPSNWQLTASDAYNGTVLWKAPIENWVNRFYPYKSGPATVARRLVATDEAVYVTLGIDAPVSELDARTGRLIRTFAGTSRTDEIVLAGHLLLLVVRPELDVPTIADDLTIREGAGRATYSAEQKAHLVAVERGSGQRVWQVDSPIAPLGIAADEARVYICDFDKVRAFDRTSGKPLWDSAPLPVLKSYASKFGPRLAVQDGVVLFAGSEKAMSKDPKENRGWASPSDTLTALSAETGRQLWTTDHPASGFQSPEDVFVIRDTVWFGATKDGRGKGTVIGVDLNTGEIKSRFEPDDNSSYWWHQRCYPQKATETYLITSRTGVEYVDPVAQHWELNHWVRGACTYGIMPANGMTYAPQHPCACYPESKLSGMNAMVARQRYSLTSDTVADRLDKGPAYADTLSDTMKAKPGDWPLLRHDVARSSYNPGKLSGTPQVSWRTRVSDDLTSPVVANGMLFVADKTNHTVFALNAADGRKVWSFSAGGRVDSPPAFAYGHVVFGSRDGHVYCLRAADGVLRWRFLAAPQDKRIFNFEQLESAWPVFGSVLVMDKDVYLTAGRSIFLDGGITFYRLDLATGDVLVQKQIGHMSPEGENYHALVDNLSMPPGNNDVLSSNGKNIFMSSQILTMDGDRIMTPAGARNDAAEHSHIFSPTGMLDDSWWHRGYFAYGDGVSGGAGWTSTLKTVTGGKLLCADDENVYIFGRQSKYNRWTLPLEFHLASISMNQKKGSSDISRATELEAKSGTAQRKDKKRRNGPSRARDMSNPFRVNWSTTIPIWVKAMFVTDNAVVVAGPKDLYDEEKAVAVFRANDPRFSLQQEHMEGKHGAVLKIFDKSVGQGLLSMNLQSMPVFDGMILAGGKVFMSTVDGTVLCFAVEP